MRMQLGSLLLLLLSTSSDGRLQGSKQQQQQRHHDQRRTQTTSQQPFLVSPDTGILVMEAENTLTPSPFWSMEAYVAGYTGYSYLRFTGNRIENGPPLGLLQYTFTTPPTNTTTYALALRSNKNNTLDPTVSNDCYTRIVEAPAYTEFTKTYARGPALLWNWNTNWELADGSHPEPTYVLNGNTTYTLEIAGRSQHYVLDRIVLYDIAKVGADPNVALDVTLPESERAARSVSVEHEDTEDDPGADGLVTTDQTLDTTATTATADNTDSSTSSSQLPSILWINAGDEQEDLTRITGASIWMSRFPAEIDGIPPPYDTVPDAFRTHRSGTAFSYTLADASVLQPNTVYAVTLGFAENYVVACRTGRRIFSVLVNGVPFVTAFDVFTAAGSQCNTAVVLTQDHTTNAEGQFVIEFIPSKQNPMVSVIGIEESSGGTGTSDTLTTTTTTTSTPEVITTTTVATPVVPADPAEQTEAVVPTEPAPVTTTSNLQDLVLIDATTGDTLLSLLGEEASAVEWDIASWPTTELAIVAIVSETLVNRVRFQYMGLTQNEGRAPFSMAGKSRGAARAAPVLANPGTFTLLVTVYDGTAELESKSIDISITESVTSRGTVKPLPADEVMIDAGSVGEDTSYVFGNTWVSMSSESISGVPGLYDEASLQTHRSGQAPFGYSIPGFAPDEPLEITLGFAETSFCSEGARVFDILVNNLTFMSNFDVFAMAGCNAALMVRGKTAATMDGTLEISFLKQVQNPMVSFVSILRLVQADAVENESSSTTTEPETDTEEGARDITNVASNTAAVETTGAPSTTVPATVAPSTGAPSTSAPSTSAPSTAVPTTSAPTTSAPTTFAPTTSAPTEAFSDFPSNTPSVTVASEVVSPFAAARLIDAGSASDDRSIISGRVWVSGTEETIGGIPRGIPMEMLQSHRTGRSPFSYNLDGFQPFGLANITLGFAEIFEPFCETGSRVFSVDINQVPLLSNIDVYDIVGCNHAFVVDGIFQADVNGVFELTLTSINENPMISLIAIEPLSPVQSVRSDGADFSEASSSISTSTLLITSTDDIGDVGVIMPNTTKTWTFPQDIANVPAGIDPAVFQTHRSGSMFSYILGGFEPYQPASISIGFAENYEPNCVATKRLFDIEVNQLEFQYDIDVFGSVGCNTAMIITKQFDADVNGMFAIDFYSVKRDPLVSLIAIDTEDSEMAVAGTPKPSPSASTAIPGSSSAATSNPTSISNQIGRVANMPSDMPSASAPMTAEPSTVAPTSIPTTVPTTTSPTASPSLSPSDQPSNVPSSLPTVGISSLPSDFPSSAPSTSPTDLPSAFSSDIPSGMPTSAPTGSPTIVFSGVPSPVPTPGPTEEPVITAVHLVDATTTEIIGPILEGSTFDLSETGAELSVLVETMAVGFVRFRYEQETQTEGAAPFVLGGKNAATGSYWSVPFLASEGSKSVEVDVVLEDGTLAQSTTYSFEITQSMKAPSPTTSAPTATPVILAMSLVDVDTKEKILPLTQGASYDIADVGSFLSILVETSPIGFVRFQFDGQVKTEGNTPYLMGGKMATTEYVPVPYLSYPGSKTIVIAAFHPDNYVLQRKEVSFTVTETSGDQSVVTADSVVTPDAVEETTAGSEIGNTASSINSSTSTNQAEYAPEESNRAAPVETSANSTNVGENEDVGAPIESSSNAIGNESDTTSNQDEEGAGQATTNSTTTSQGEHNTSITTEGSNIASNPDETTTDANANATDTEDRTGDLLIKGTTDTLTEVLIDAGSDTEDRSAIEGKNWASVSKDNITSVPQPYTVGVFQSHRSGYLFNYTVSGFAPNTPASLSLGFAENYEPYCQVGKRVFDVIVNGIDFERNLDVFRSAQDCFTALVITESVTSNSNGEYELEFRPVRGNPMLSLIAISEEEPTMSSSVAAPTPSSYINNITLVSAIDRSIIMMLQDGGLFDLSELDEALSLVVDTVEGVASIRFKWNGLVHKEGTSPYSMGGKSGSYELQSIPYLSYPGEKTVILELFDEADTLLQTEQITFLIDDVTFFTESSVTTTFVPDTIINAGTEDEDPNMMDGSVWNSFFPDNITNVPDSLPMEYLKYHRSGYKFNYTLTGYTPGNLLDLSLVFAENYEPNCVTTKRLFDVVVNDEAFATNVDVYGAVGCFAGYSITETVTADASGSLHIQFLPVKRHPMVSAIIVSQSEMESSDAPSLVPSDAPSMVPSISVADTVEKAEPVMGEPATSEPLDPITTASVSTASYIAGYFLVNAENRLIVKIINNGDVVSLSGVGAPPMSIVVDVVESESVSHVRFRWAGQQHIEGRSPYAINGKNSETGFNAVNYLNSPGAKSITLAVFGLDQKILEEATLSFIVEE